MNFKNILAALILVVGVGCSSQQPVDKSGWNGDTVSHPLLRFKLEMSVKPDSTLGAACRLVNGEYKTKPSNYFYEITIVNPTASAVTGISVRHEAKENGEATTTEFSVSDNESFNSSVSVFKGNYLGNLIDSERHISEVVILHLNDGQEITIALFP